MPLGPARSPSPSPSRPRSFSFLRPRCPAYAPLRKARGPWSLLRSCRSCGAGPRKERDPVFQLDRVRLVDPFIAVGLVRAGPVILVLDLGGPDSLERHRDLVLGDVLVPVPLDDHGIAQGVFDIGDLCCESFLGILAASTRVLTSPTSFSVNDASVLSLFSSPSRDPKLAAATARRPLVMFGSAFVALSMILPASSRAALWSVRLTFIFSASVTSVWEPSRFGAVPAFGGATVTPLPAARCRASTG